LLLPLAAKNATLPTVTAACLNAQNARPALRLAGRKTASGIFLRTAQTRVRKPRRKSLHTRRVEASAATKSASGVRYYGRRYYNPTLGRWLGRDPIEEKGGLHLYGFVRNNGVNRWDYLGMDAPVQMGAFGNAPTRTEREVDGDGNEWEVIYSDISDVAYGMPEWAEIGRTKISSPVVLINSDPGRDGAPAAGDSSVPNSVPDARNKPDPKKLPGCSELRKQLADGTYHPALTVESFIPGQTESGFHGDGRGFIDSPSSPADGTTSRVSVTSNYYPTLGGATGGTQIQAPAVGSRVDPSYLAVAPSFPLTGTVSPQTVNVSYNNVAYMSVGYSSMNPFGPSGIMRMTGMDIRADMGVQIDLNTGMLTGSVNRSAFPANQVFFNGQSVYQGNASPKGARGLLDNASGKISGTQVCDPSR
jgi:RHS repeat-associated protein